MADRPQTDGRRILSWVVRVLFLVAAAAFAAWSFRDDWPAIGAAIGSTSPLRLAVSGLLWAIGLSVTLPMWLLLVRGFGHSVPVRQAARILYVGQLGKYIPGSVWSVGAQAQLSRRYDVPLRTGVAVGLLYIGVHLTAALGVGGATVLAGVLELGIPRWIGGVVVVAALVVLSPPVLNSIGTAVSARGSHLRLGWRSSAAIVALMAVAFAGWGGSVAALVPGALSAQQIALVAGAFALSYAAGLVVIIAPSGLGVREGVLIGLLAPVCGVPTAAAVAALSRIISAVIDFGWAGISQLLARGSEPEGELPRS